MVLELIAIIIFIVAIIFVFIEIKKMINNKKPSQSYGNGQYIGAMEHQNDYFSVTEISEFESLLVIIDGTSRRENIRQSAIIASDIIKDIYKKNRNLHGFKDLLDYAFLEIEDKNKQYTFENRIALSILSVRIRFDLLSYGSIGTCSLLLYRNGEIININVENEVTKKYSEIKIKPKDKVVMLTKGAFLTLTELEIIKELESNKETNEKAITLVNLIRNKGYKHQENATVLIVDIEKVYK